MRADIFCRVVDNYGDIGVTWRLARQLTQEHGWTVRLWVDALENFSRIEPGVRQASATQEIDGICIVHWTSPAPDLQPMPVAIAAFSCDLPEPYVARMPKSQSLWINLEYLSAESWVEGFHAMPSLRGDGVPCYFYFPGFTRQTGGLLREASLLETREAWCRNVEQQHSFLSQIGVPPEALKVWQGAASQAGNQRARLFSLFCYPQAPVDGLAEALQHDATPTVLLVPDGIASTLRAGRRGNLWVVRIPFLTQSDYDRLLWTADLNFVRGEDSIVRALWAGKPLIWHIYPQTEGTHLLKLEAWLTRVALPEAAQALIRHWNRDNGAAALAGLLGRAFDRKDFSTWCERAKQLCQEQASIPDLAGNLDKFCRSNSRQSAQGPERLK